MKCSNLYYQLVVRMSVITHNLRSEDSSLRGLLAAYRFMDKQAKSRAKKYIVFRAMDGSRIDSSDRLLGYFDHSFLSIGNAINFLN